MQTSRLALLPIVFATLLVPIAGAATFDYTTLWTHLADTELDHFLYDCGGVVDLVVKGNFAYAVDSWQGLQVIDCTDPTAIVYRGFLYISRPVGCDVRDHILYVVKSDGQIAVVDVDDHDQPVLINQVPVGGTPRDVRVLGPWLYVLTGDNTLRIFSLAVASTPTPVGTASLPAGRSDRLDLDGGRLFVAGTGGLAVYDVTIPEWPLLLGTHDFTGSVDGFDVRDGLALIGQDPQSRLIDVSDPAAMVELATLDSEGNGALLTSNSQAWLGWGFYWYSSGMNVFDVSTPTAPELFHQEIQGFRGWPEAMVEYQGHVHVGEFMCWCAGEWPAFHIFQVGEFPLPGPLATRTCDGAFGLLRFGQRIHVATRVGIETWDLSEPSAPELVHTLEGSSFFWDLAEDDGLIATCRLVPSSDCWLQLITRDAGGDLVSRGEVPVDYYPRGIAISGALALLAYYDGGGILAVDVSDPDAPTIAASLLAGQVVRDVALHGDLAVASTAAALLVLDIADLQQPLVLAQIPHGVYWKRECLAFIERDDRLLLTAARNQSFNYDGGFAEVYDLTDPGQPELLVQLGQLGMMDVGETVWRDDLLVVPGSTHLTFYRWTGVAAPVEFAGRVPVSDELSYLDFRSAAVIDQAVATIFWDGDLQTWPLPAGLLTEVTQQMPVPARLEVVAVPNPFNPACEIRFALPDGGRVTVEVYDLRGRRLRELLDETRPAGWHAARWDGRDQTGLPAASGVYVARIRTGGAVTATKFTLAR